MRRNYKYRLYPNRQQANDLSRVLEIHRQLYNAALEERRMAWSMSHKSISYVEQANQLKPLRQLDEDAAWLNYTSTQQTLRRLDKAFTAFFRRIWAGETPGYPRFKSENRWHSVEYRYSDGVKIVNDGNRQLLRIQNIGSIKVKWHRTIPVDAEIRSVYLKREIGKWYVVFSLNLPEATTVAPTGEAIGLDLGLESFATLSDGQKINNPRWFRKSQQKLTKAQRKLAHRKKGSQRRKKQALLVAKIHRKIGNQRRDFHHKLAHKLATKHLLIAVENLGIGSMTQNHHLAKSISDAGWGQFVLILQSKVESTGSQVVKVSPRYTSQICSGCGSMVKKPLVVRIHICPECGLILDRDHNAALNILSKARTGPTVNSLTAVEPSREAARP